MAHSTTSPATNSTSSNNRTKMDATILSPQTNFSTKDIARFSSGVAGYRIVRLSIELFLVVRINELSLGVSQAGLVYLLYSLSNIITGLFLFQFPMAILVGASTQAGALVFPVLSTTAMTGGLVGMFLSQSFHTMITSSLFSGGGTGLWFIYYQTLSNTAFSKAQMGMVSKMRQAYECLGFLLPSVCLAIVNSTSEYLSSTSDSISSSSKLFANMSIIQLSAVILGVLACIFHLTSFPMMTTAATSLSVKGSTSTSASSCEEDEEDQEPQESVWKALKHFFGTNIRQYFFLQSLLVASSAIVFGISPLTTEIFFGLPPTYLWIAAIGFPIGGIFTVGSGIVLKNWIQQDPKSAALGGTARFAVMLALIIIIYPIVSVQKVPTAKFFLFVFGLTMGILYSSAYVSAVELWLLRLKDCHVSFVSRASAFNKLGLQAVIAGVFQLQTILVEETLTEESSKWVEGLVLLGPLVGLFVLAHMVARTVPYPKDPVFGWPLKDPFGGRINRIIMFLADKTGVCPISTSSFAYFSDNRTNLFAEHHLSSSAVQSGPQVDPSTSLDAAGLEVHLQKFHEECGSTSWDTWHQSKATIQNIIPGNGSSLQDQLKLIAEAQSEIWITTWTFEDSQSGNALANALIKKAREGIDVRVIVDGCNLFYLHSKEQLTGKMQETKVLKKLVNGGVEVRMLDTWFEDKEPAYVCGSHRKMMLIDGSILMTGGRNLSDEYLTSNGSHYFDVDVTITGTFSDNTHSLYKNLWGRSRDLHRTTGNKEDKGHVMNTDECGHNASEALTGSEFLSSNALRGNSLGADIECDSTYNNESTDVSTEPKPISSPYYALDIDKQTLSVVHESDTKLEPRDPLDPQSSLTIDQEIALFQLDHKAGNPEGQDIVYSTLLYLIEKAEEKIDLVFGYFQLLPGLEDALVRAMARGVKIRLITNSENTNDIKFYNEIIGRSMNKVLELGVEVYFPASYKTDCRFHYKMAIVDDKAAMLGSWNCYAFSVFHDDEFSVVMFGQSDAEAGHSALGKALLGPFEEAVKGGHLIKVESIPEGSYVVPFHMRACGSKNAHRQFARGF